MAFVFTYPPCMGTPHPRLRGCPTAPVAVGMHRGFEILRTVASMADTKLRRWSGVSNAPSDPAFLRQALSVALMVVVSKSGIVAVAGWPGVQRHLVLLLWF